jgi:hypothetical protein
MTNTPVILTHDLTKSYGSLAAVQALNLSVGPNRITAFLAGWVLCSAFDRRRLSAFRNGGIGFILGRR